MLEILLELALAQEVVPVVVGKLQLRGDDRTAGVVEFVATADSKLTRGLRRFEWLMGPEHR